MPCTPEAIDIFMRTAFFMLQEKLQMPAVLQLPDLKCARTA